MLYSNIITIKVLIFRKKNISFDITHTILSLCKVTISNINFRLHNMNFAVVACYRSPSPDDELFWMDIENYFNDLPGDDYEICLGILTLIYLTP